MYPLSWLQLGVGGYPRGGGGTPPWDKVGKGAPTRQWCGRRWGNDPTALQAINAMNRAAGQPEYPHPQAFATSPQVRKGGGGDSRA